MAAAVNEPGPTNPSAEAEEPVLIQLLSEQVDWDWTSSTPLPHLTYILNTFIPTWHPLVAISGIVKTRNENIYKQLEDEYKDNSDMKLILTGSFCENLSVPSYVKRSQKRLLQGDEIARNVNWSDIDMMVAVIGKDVGYGKKYRYQIETSDTEPGYLRLVFEDPSNPGSYCVEHNGKVYLSSSKLMNNFEESGQSRVQLANPDAQVDVTGPALTVQSENMPDIDSVICLSCPEWPKEANDWQQRERTSGWPSADLIKQITKDGCHVVPVAHRKSQLTDVEWRYSFAKAEVKLAQSLTLVQRQCYMLLKTVVKFELSPPDLISSYCLKNLFFWTMEKVPVEQWEDGVNGLGAIFLCLLDEILYALINENLPHYFICKNNLISHIPEDFIQDLMAKVSKMRRDPIKYLLAFDKIYGFPFSPVNQTLSEVLEPVLEDRKKYHDVMKNCIVAQLKSMTNLITVYIKDCQFDGAWAVCQRLCQLKSCLGQNIQPEQYMDAVVLEFPPEHAILVYEFLMKTCSNVGGSLLGNMACMYTSLYCSELDGPRKDEYRQKADSNFQKALGVEEVRAASVVDYTVFLRAAGESATAIPLLQQVLQKDKDTTCANSYGLSEHASLDEHLKAEIDERNCSISVSSLIWAFYHLAHCYMKNDHQSTAVELMPDFEAACEKFSDQELVFSLLGYTYYALGDHKKASEAFGKAIKINPNYRSAVDNKMLCDAMCLSLASEDE